jgi:hypothetical protein
MSTDVFEIRLCQIGNMYIETGCVIYKNRICQYVNTTDRIIVDHYIAILT